ncbi:MAG: NAD(P)-binding domain-containing protein [Nanoarchaeota archaeon]
MKREVYDAIIIGAGPAGLSVGSELSKKHKILVLDKKTKVNHTTKSWFVPKFTYENNKDLKKFMYGDIKRMLTNTFTGKKNTWKTNLKQGYSFIKEKELLDYWGDVITKNESKILLKCSYKSHELTKKLILVKTSLGNFNCKLLIDASGHNSKILKKYKKNDKDLYWWSIFGCLAEHPRKIKNMKIGDYMLWATFKSTNNSKSTPLAKGRPIFEYEILDERTSFPLILYLKKSKVPYKKMKEEFVRLLRKEKTTKNFHDVNVNEWKYGWYPSGGLSQKIAEDRVAFIGDAACWTTPCGWGMGFILQNYKIYARQLGKAIRKDTLDKENLIKIIKLNVHEKHEILFNQITMHFLSNATTQQVDKFIKFFNSLDFLICEKLFTLTINKKELQKVLKDFLDNFSLIELMNILPPEDYLLVLEEASYFIEDSIINNMKELLGKKNEINKKGFEFK